MAKNTSKEAYYERLKNLADVNKTSIKESQTRNLGTLIDYKRAADGVAYGIIKENHHYYLKKAGTKQDPNVADFAYIGGMSNITDYQYKSLAEADKQRNMMFHVINEAKTLKPNKSKSKMVLTEDVAGKEIDQAASKLGDLDAATSAAEIPANTAPEGGAEMAAGLEAEPAGPDGTNVAPEELPAEVPAAGDEELPVGPEGGEEEVPAPDATGDEELPADGDEVPADGDEVPADGETEENREIEKSLGKLTNKLRKTDLTDSQVKSYVNTFLSAFKDKFPDIEIEDRKAMADKITKVVPDDEIEDLGKDVEKTDGPDAGSEEESVAEAQQCAECGSFAMYAESRGYGSAESLMECGEEEVGNLVSGYANAHNDGMNDGDLDNVALVIKVVNPEILNQLKGDYGHEDYANELEPIVTGMNESSDEENVAKLNELFGGLKNLGQAAMGGIKQGAQAVGQKVGQGVQAVKTAGQQAGKAVQNKAQQVGQKVGQAANAVAQTYHAGEVAGEVKKLQNIATDLGKQIEAYNSRMTKAGQQPIDVKNILKAVTQQVTGKGAGIAGLNPVAEGMTDPADVEVQPVEEAKGTKLAASAPVKLMKEEDEPEGEELEVDDIDVKDDAGEEKPFEKSGDKPLSFAPAAQSLGVSTIKPDGAGVQISIEPDKSVNISMNESEKKLRKYIRARLEEKIGARKPVLAEGKKSATLLKLDAIIDGQFKLYESVVKKKLSEEKPSAGLTKAEKSGIVKKAKKGEDIGKPGKGFEKVADKAAKEYGSKEAGKKVAAAAMWKNAKKESVVKEGYEMPIDEIFGLSIAEKFAKLDPNNEQEVKRLFVQAFHDILTNPQLGAIGRAARRTPVSIMYELVKQYVEDGGGTLRTTPDGNMVQFAPKALKDKSIPSEFRGGGTQGKTNFGGVAGQ